MRLETVLPMPPDGSLDVTPWGTEQSTSPPGLWPAEPSVCEPVTGGVASLAVVSRRRTHSGHPAIVAVSLLVCPCFLCPGTTGIILFGFFTLFLIGQAFGF